MEGVSWSRMEEEEEKLFNESFPIKALIYSSSHG